MFLPICIYEISRNQDKLIKNTSVSSISTDWSIQSISTKSDLPIFIDLSIDYSGIALRRSVKNLESNENNIEYFTWFNWQSE